MSPDRYSDYLMFFLEVLLMEMFSLLRQILVGLLVAAAFSSGNLYAAETVLNFEGVGDLASVNEFYNGGTDSLGNSGMNYGVYFSDDADGIIDLDADFDFSGNFANEPSPGAALIFREGGEGVMNVMAGFDTGLSLSYSSSSPAVVIIYDGLDGTGNQLATLSLAANYRNNNCSGDPFGDYCHWDRIGAAFNGRARSLVFKGPREYTFYDNITLGSAETAISKNVRPNKRKRR
jgi:hypothetical protein